MDKLQVALTKQQKHLQKVVDKTLGQGFCVEVGICTSALTGVRHEVQIWEGANLPYLTYCKSRNKAIAWIKSLKQETK